MKPFKYIKKKVDDWRYRRGYEIASGVMLFNNKENGFDEVVKILQETEVYTEYHRGIYAAMSAFKFKCRQ